jgi:chondroitin AC lyase
MHGDLIVCLISDFRGNIRGRAFTTLDQCRLRGPVTVNKPGNVLATGTHELKNVKWIHHAGFVYIPIWFFGTDMKVELKSTSGQWKSINSSQSEKIVTESVFIPSLDHGHLLQGQAGGYVLAPAPSPQHANAVASTPEWTILRNDNNCQALLFNDGTVAVSFLTTAPLEHTKVNLEVDKPCLILISNNRMFISDPTFKGGAVRVRRNNLVWNVNLPANGGTLEVGPDSQ